MTEVIDLTWFENSPVRRVKTLDDVNRVLELHSYTLSKGVRVTVQLYLDGLQWDWYDRLQVYREKLEKYLIESTEGGKEGVKPDMPVRPSIETPEEFLERFDPYIQATRKRRMKAGIEISGVMCSATKDDMYGLSAIRDYVKSGKEVNFHFDNGSQMLLTPDNLETFEEKWIPFRAGFF